MYRPEDIDQRWLKTFQVNEPGEVASNVDLGGVVCKTVPTKTVPHNWNDKFNHSLGQAKVLCTLLAESGEDQYQKRFEVLLTLAALWSDGKEVAVLEVVQNFHGQYIPSQ